MNNILLVKVTWVCYAKIVFIHRKYLKNTKIGYIPNIPNKGDYTRNPLKNDGLP